MCVRLRWSRGLGDGGNEGTHCSVIVFSLSHLFLEFRFVFVKVLVAYLFHQALVEVAGRLSRVLVIPEMVWLSVYAPVGKTVRRI